MYKLLFHLALASILSGVVFTPDFAFAQDGEAGAPAKNAADISSPSPAISSDVRAPAADSPAPATSNAVKNKGEKVKNLNFEDELVQGEADKPELFYLFQKKNFNYKRLIKLRENFLPEMRKTSEEVQRVRSQD